LCETFFGPLFFRNPYSSLGAGGSGGTSPRFLTLRLWDVNGKEHCRRGIPRTIGFFRSATCRHISKLMTHAIRRFSSPRVFVHGPGVGMGRKGKGGFPVRADGLATWGEKKNSASLKLGALGGFVAKRRRACGGCCGLVLNVRNAACRRAPTPGPHHPPRPGETRYGGGGKGQGEGGKSGRKKEGGNGQMHTTNQSKKGDDGPGMWEKLS